MKKETRIVMDIIGECPECGGPLRETYSSEIAFCPNCKRQFKI